MTCTRCTAPATASYRSLPLCRSHFEAAIVEEATAILERAALDIEGFRAPAKLVMHQNDPAGTWSFEAPTYTLEGQG
jgi:hypothetical protein